MNRYVGFQRVGERIKEYLPSSEQLLSTNEKRVLFFNLYNFYVDKKLRLSRKEMLNGANIYEVFKNKIDSISNKSLKKEFAIASGINNEAMFFDLEDMFLHLVYERIKPVNKDAKIHLFDKAIIIQPNNKNLSSTLVIPAYTKIKKEQLHNDPIVSLHLQTTLKTLKETQIRQIYLVYPKHPNFKKHIEIKLMEKLPLKEDEYRVKMIPYSFSFCTRTVKKYCSCA